jgi:hypothetical protein
MRKDLEGFTANFFIGKVYKFIATSLFKLHLNSSSGQAALVNKVLESKKKYIYIYIHIFVCVCVYL